MYLLKLHLQSKVKKVQKYTRIKLQNVQFTIMINMVLEVEVRWVKSLLLRAVEALYWLTEGPNHLQKVYAYVTGTKLADYAVAGWKFGITYLVCAVNGW